MPPKNRCAIYVYWDPQEVLREFAHYYVRELKKCCTRVLFIVNGNLDNLGINSLKSDGIEVYERKNSGYDFHAYKYGIELLGDDLTSFDELVIANSSTYGPLFPFSQVFEKMETRVCDFWGLTGHSKTELIDQHIQSYFVVFRKKCICSDSFKKFWENLPLVKDRNEAIEKCEIQLTPYFANCGFIWDTLIPISAHEKISPEISIRFADYGLRQGLPLVKRKLFTTERVHYLACSNVREPASCLKYIKENTHYDVNFIFDDLLATSPQSHWNGLIEANKILSTSDLEPLKSNIFEKRKTAIILFVYFDDLIGEIEQYLNKLSKHISIFIVSPKQQLLKVYREKFSDKFENIEFRLHPNRGRNETAYFIVCRDVLENYDYICLLHDKKCAHLPLEIYGRTFQSHCLDSLIYNNSYVNRIIETFEENPKLGILTPPWPIFGCWDGPASCNFESNISEISQLYKSFKMEIPLDTNILFPVGTMFWVRRNALSTLLKRNWQIEDFPEEPMANDGTILHAMERMYCLFAQNTGYYSGWIMPDKYASTYIENILSRLYPQKYRTPEMASATTSEQIVTYKQFKTDARLFFRRKIREYLKRLAKMGI